MEIQALKVLFTEDELNRLLEKHLPKDRSVEELRLRLTPEGVYVHGEYPLFVQVAFETLWELEVREGRVAARLVNFRALGMPVMIFRSAMMSIIADTAAKADWLAVEEDAVLVDVDRLLAKNGLPARTNLTAVRLQVGMLVIEAGNGAG
jgi:hypothetical protein